MLANSVVNKCINVFSVIQKLGFVAYDMRPKITFHVSNEKDIYVFSYIIVEYEIAHFASPVLVFYSICNETILPSWKLSSLIQC